jgi:hypothetical protein
MWLRTIASIIRAERSGGKSATAPRIASFSTLSCPRRAVSNSRADTIRVSSLSFVSAAMQRASPDRSTSAAMSSCSSPSSSA